MSYESPRLYVGNLPYVAQREDIEKLFAENHVDINKVDISIDPETGRNPSYCFVEFKTQEDATNAMNSLQGINLQGRALRINPKTDRKPNPTAERTARGWGPRATDGNENSYPNNRWKREDAQPQWNAPAEDPKRVYVGSLHASDQETINAEMKSLFEGYEINEISKLITPHESKQTESGNHHYCFATFDRQEEAQRGVEAMNGQPTPNGGIYKISFARERPAGNFGQADRFQQREGGYQSRGGFQQRDGFQQREGGQDSPRRQQREQPQGPPVNRDFGSSWRRRD
ncbi:ribonucleoprotein [Sphaerulina musiva]